MSICKTFVCSFFALIIFLTIGNATTMADEVKQVSVNGYEFAYVEQGQGEPVIFVHGGLQDYRMWSEQLPKFAVHYRAIAYSRRNDYPNVVSPEGMPDSAADLHGEDIAAFVRALGLSKIRVVAHSSGAHAALFFAATHPDMVVSLALNEPPAMGLLNGVPNSMEILKEFVNTQAPAREALKAGDVHQGIPMIVNAIGGPGAYERRSDAHQKMNLDDVARIRRMRPRNGRDRFSPATWPGRSRHLRFCPTPNEALLCFIWS
ncbi:alpha/beta hydrolase [Bradyrhizobium sp. UFLA06-06]